jgi:hypothetical protein
VSTARCPHCGQAMPITRLDLPMSALKARVFGAVKRAGQAGIESDDLFELVFTRAEIPANT